MPPYLYKFTSLSQYTYEAIALGKAWFSSPALLNDPYDGQLPVDTSVSNGSEAFSLAVEMIEMATGWNGIGTLPFDPDASNYQELFQRFTFKWLDTGNDIGIYSMTEVVDHLLLWAHYADSHKGLAIRYKIDASSKISDGQRIDIEPVAYVDYLPAVHIKDVLNDFPGTLKTRFTTKGSVWKYEQEWRAISTKANCLLSAPGIVDQIIFGHRMPPSSRQALRQIAGTSVTYFEARPKDNDFAVEIVAA